MQDCFETADVETRPSTPASAALEDNLVSPPVQVRIPASAEYVKIIRDLVDCLCQLRSLSDDARASIKLAVGEAVNNAVLYAQSANGLSAVEVSISLLDNVLEIEVANESGGFSPNTPSKMPDAELLAERGRGLALMNIMMDEVEYVSRGSQTIARMRKWLK
jgi:serine/threonine-protein kinase RsbW